MGRRQSDSKPRRSRRDRRRTDGGNEQTPVEQPRGHRKSRLLVAHHHRDDGRRDDPAALRSVDRRRTSISRVPSSERTMLSAASAAAVSGGVSAVVKMNDLARLTSRSTSDRDPATHPPSDPRVFDSVPMRTTTSGSPSPGSRWGPSTACASSSTSSAPCRRQRSTSAPTGATSPSIENTESVTTSTRPGRRGEQFVEMVEVAVSVDRDLRPAEPAAVDDRGVVQLVAQDGHVRAGRAS